MASKGEARVTTQEVLSMREEIERHEECRFHGYDPERGVIFVSGPVGGWLHCRATLSATWDSVRRWLGGH